MVLKMSSFMGEILCGPDLGEDFVKALNFSFDTLISERGLKIKVPNPEKYEFEPKEFMVKIAQIYSNLSL